MNEKLIARYKIQRLSLSLQPVEMSVSVCACVYVYLWLVGWFVDAMTSAMFGGDSGSKGLLWA